MSGIRRGHVADRAEGFDRIGRISGDLRLHLAPAMPSAAAIGPVPSGMAMANATRPPVEATRDMA
jgi:hypothetical protein